VTEVLLAFHGYDQRVEVPDIATAEYLVADCIVRHRHGQNTLMAWKIPGLIPEWGLT